MKTTLLVLVLSCVFPCSFIDAQTKQTALFPDSVKPKKPADKYPTIDLYMALPFHQNGWGAGMGFFSPSVNFKSPYQPLHVRIGGEFYMMELAHRSLGNVPLNAPQTGDAKIRLSQNTLGFNFIARFSAAYSERITPYGDLFVGARNSWTALRITPNQKQDGYDESTSQTLASSWQFSYGASAGVLWRLNKNVKLNTGLMYTSNLKAGQIADIAKANVVSGTIVTENTSAPKNLWVLKVGLTILIDDEETKKRKCHCDCDHHDSNVWNNTSTNTRSANTRSNHVNVNVRSSK